MNTLYYGDNLDILRNKIKDETVDLIYLDPPFKSGVNYNLLFQAAGDDAVDAQVEAFKDTWKWGSQPKKLLMTSEITANSALPFQA
jgi:16S rRNA G966 N2-methylase RsmD